LPFGGEFASVLLVIKQTSLSIDMAEDYIPPYPEPLEKPPSLLQQVTEGQKCPLRLLTRNMYRMKMGQSKLLFGRQRFLLVDPPLVRRVLRDAEKIYPKSGLIWRMLSPVIGNSIFVSNGDVWARQRKLLEPAFTETRVSRSFAKMCGAVDTMMTRLEQAPNGSVVDIEPIMTHVTADIIFRTICSVSISESDAQETYDAFKEYQQLAYGDMGLRFVGIANVLSPRWWRSKKAAKRIREIMDPMVRDRYRRHQAGEPDTHQDILSALFAARSPDTGEPMNFEYHELVEQIAMLFLAGHETSAAALSWCLYLMAATPHFQERVHAEAAGQFGGRPIEPQDVKALSFCRDVFRETLRLYPSVPFLARDATRAETMRDKTIAPGDTLLLSPWLSHRNERNWDKPQVFDPDRYSRSETQKSVQEAYFPFSAGPRVCLGASFAMQEAVLVLSNIFKRFRLEAVSGEVPTPVAQLTLRSTNGIKVRIFRHETP
jgi:cytochrome P450